MPKALKILAVLLICLTTSISAQTDFITKPTADSTKTKPTADRSILIKDTMRINERYKLIHPVYNLNFYIEENLDTSVQNIHYYLPTEQDTEIWQQPSNLGQPAYMLSVPDAKPLNIRLGTPNTSVYNFNRTNTPFYQNEAPYTNAGLYNWR